MNVAIYVTGSIAAYKALSLVRRLVLRGDQVKVVMTEGAVRFVQPLAFRVLSQNPVVTEKRAASSRGVLHVDLARWTDVALVVPATANVIAKLANGIADTVVTTCLLAANLVPKIIVPAMNSEMWANPATRRNLRTLSRYRNYYLLEPVTGRLAEGCSGKGRMLEPEQIVTSLDRLLALHRQLAGRRILVTAGGTEEPLDPVRFITNNSTGRMGCSIARVAWQMGAQVRLICGRVTIPIPSGVKVQRVRTTEQMNMAVLKAFPRCDALIMAAALADFSPVKVARQKIHKRKADRMVVKLKKTPDVLRHVTTLKQPDQMTVGFAAETQHLIASARRKLKQKHLDMIVANDVSDSRIGFSSDNNQVTFLRPHHHPLETPVESKLRIARRLLTLVAARLKVIEGN